MKNIISTKDLTKDIVEEILSRAEKMEKAYYHKNIPQLLSDKIIACIFFEPSTRTRLSFETAALKLGAQIISAENAEANSSSFKGETIEDTTKILCSYADALVMRHPKPGIMELASNVSTKPIINAGDGSNQHPSQGLLDLYTIKKEIGSLENLNIVFVGDILHSRTLNSLVPLLSLYFGNKFSFISPKELVISEEQKKKLIEKNILFSESDNLEKILPTADVVYMIRMQKERFANSEDYEKIKNSFILKKDHLKLMKEKSIIMHPLPRVNEIEIAIDSDKRAAYFRQAQNGLFIRMSILLNVFNL